MKTLILKFILIVTTAWGFVFPVATSSPVTVTQPSVDTIMVQAVVKKATGSEDPVEQVTKVVENETIQPVESIQTQATSTVVPVQTIQTTTFAAPVPTPVTQISVPVTIQTIQVKPTITISAITFQNNLTLNRDEQRPHAKIGSFMLQSDLDAQVSSIQINMETNIPLYELANLSLSVDTPKRNPSEWNTFPVNVSLEANVPVYVDVFADIIVSGEDQNSIEISLGTNDEGNTIIGQTVNISIAPSPLE